MPWTVIDDLVRDLTNGRDMLRMPWWRVCEVLRYQHIYRSVREGRGLSREQDVELQKLSDRGHDEPR